MDHLRFTMHTLLGVGIWCSVLTGIGYSIGDNREMVLRYPHTALWVTLVGCVIILAEIHILSKTQGRRAFSPDGSTAPLSFQGTFPGSVSFPQFCRSSPGRPAYDSFPGSWRIRKESGGIMETCALAGRTIVSD